MTYVPNSGPPGYQEERARAAARYRQAAIQLDLAIRQAEADIMRIARAIAVGTLQGDEALDALRAGIARQDAAQAALVASWQGEE